MTAYEFRTAVGTLGGQARAAALLGEKKSNVRKWLNGNREIPGEVAQHVEALVREMDQVAGEMPQALRGAAYETLEPGEQFERVLAAVGERGVVTGGLIELDGLLIRNCLLEAVHLEYAGGGAFAFEDVELVDCSFSFEDGALNAINSLAYLQAAGLTEIVEAVVESIREGRYL